MSHLTNTKSKYGQKYTGILKNGSKATSTLGVEGVDTSVTLTFPKDLRLPTPWYFRFFGRVIYVFGGRRVTTFQILPLIQLLEFWDEAREETHVRALSENNFLIKKADLLYVY